jgi:signal transduction histidine kinase/DNA-binding response OmpR family regulator
MPLFVRRVSFFEKNVSRPFAKKGQLWCMLLKRLKARPVFVVALVQLFFLASCLCPASGHAQVLDYRDIGKPFIQNFDPEEYQASTQNWDVIQDSLGLIYIANGRGLLIYNGETFDLLKMPHGHSVRSLAIDAQYRIYCGGAGYFGYLTHQEQGGINFVNLADSIPKSDARSFSNVEDIYCTPHGIYFRSPETLFLWKEDNFRFWDSEGHRFFSSFWVNDQLFINRKGLGIQMVSDQGHLLSPGGGSIMAEKAVTLILPHGEDLLVGTTDSLFLWKQNEMHIFGSAVSDFLAQARLFKGRMLADGSYALSTLNDGMAIIDKWGQILLHCNLENGLPSNSIHQIYQDRNDHLWAATNNGISLVEYPSSFSIFEIGNKTPPISALTKYHDDLIVGTFNGLFRVKKSAIAPTSLQPYLGIRDRIWDLLVVGEDLFIGFEDGLSIYRRDQKLDKIATDAISDMWRSDLDTNRVIVGARKGLFSLNFVDGRWQEEMLDVKLGEGVYHIHQQLDGTLWLDVNKPWIYQIAFANRNDATQLARGLLTKLDSTAGLPGVNGYIMMHEDQIYYVDNSSLSMLKYDPKIEKFRALDPGDGPVSSLGKQLVIAHDDDNQNKWMVKFDGDVINKTFLAHISDNGESITELNEDRVYDLIGRCMYYEDGVIWHGGQDVLIRNDIRKQSSEISFNTMIDEIFYQEDSLVVAGPYHSVTSRFPFSDNSFRFTYGNTAHFANQKAQYQYLLEGYMNDWSAWTTERKRDFTNLKEGTYTFKVRSKIMNVHMGRPDVFTFAILPPWHRSWWAYILYVLTGILCTGMFVKWRSRQLQREKIALQNIVQLRTAELEVKNEQLMEQKSLLSDQTKALREVDEFKSRLFANISHEFRTPLTLIKGPLDRLKKFPDSQLTSEHVEMMDRNANRLLRLVNQVLDLSKLDAKDLPLNLAEGNVLKSIRAAASTFSSHAADRNVDYQIMVPAGQIWVAFDRDKLEKIIYNLLSNAFKFTSDTGTIKLSASHRQDVLYLSVIDTGRGISSADLPKIFDRFYQVDHSDAKDQEGSGVGLSLVRELVELMKGTIYVDSVLGQGSSFFVELPMELLNLSAIEKEAGASLSPDTWTDKLIPQFEKEVRMPASSPTVLLVEDNADMRTYIREHLDGAYLVLEAKNGPEGLKIALTKMPDLVITDLMMPKMDGLELCEIIKSDLRTSHMPVIILTAKAGLENRLEGLETGADVYLTKPFYAEELLVQINRLIEDRARLRSLFSQSQHLEPKDLQLPKLDQQFIEQVLNVLEEKFDSADFDVPQLHQIMAMSRTQLHRKMKALTGLAPGEFIRHFRLRRAAQILLTGENVAQTAYAVGFNNLSYFARSFRALHGVSPKEYANQHRDR